jgi:hypothetical protein
MQSSTSFWTSCATAGLRSVTAFCRRSRGRMALSCCRQFSSVKIYPPRRIVTTDQAGGAYRNRRYDPVNLKETEGSNLKERRKQS